MPKNKLSDLRDHLFETLERLKDEEKPMEIARAKAIADVAQTIINSATVEVKAMNAMSGNAGSGFFDAPDKRPAALPAKPNGGAPADEGIHAADPLRQRKAEPAGRAR